MFTLRNLAILVVIVLVSFIPLFIGMHKEHVNNNTPIDTFVQAGHTWDIVHSPDCKCHE